VRCKNEIKKPFQTPPICDKIILERISLNPAIFISHSSRSTRPERLLLKKAVLVLKAKEWLKQAQGINERLAALIKTNADNDMIQPLKQARSEILKVIAQVDNHILATLLIEHYINSKKWDDVARIIHYSSSYTLKTLHPRALNEISKILHGGLEA